MKQLILNIEESKFKAFLTFIKTLDYISVDGESHEIPKWQQDEVKRRLKLSDEGNMKTKKWEDVKNDLFKK